MTTDEQVSTIYTLWGEDATNSIISPAQITISLNRASRRLCLIGQLSLTCASADFVIGQELYEVPGDYLKVDSVQIENRLVDPGLVPMNVNDRDPRGTQGPPTHYYVWGGKSATTGLNVMSFGFQPVPSAIETYHIWFRQKPVKQVHSTEGAMVNSELNETFQDAQNDFALMEIYRRLGPDYAQLYVDQRATWKQWEMEAKNFVNPLMNDRPIPRRDTMGYAFEIGP